MKTIYSMRNTIKKSLTVFVVTMVSAVVSRAQNTFPSTGNVGIGTTAPSGTLHVVSTTGVSKDTAAQYSGNLIIQSNTGGRDMMHGAELEFAIPAHTDGSNVWGQGRILTVSGNTTNSNATGKMILGTRRGFDKLGTGTQWYYGDDITIDGHGYVGIGKVTPVVPLDVQGLSNFSDQLYSHNGLRVFSSATDRTNGAPWYGIGAVDSASFGTNLTQVAGYWGLYFKTANAQMFMTLSGNVGIGLTSNISERLTVDGNVKAKEVIVTASGWPDYVFKKDYRLPSLSALSEQIKAEGHLPDMPSAAQMEQNGLSLGAINKLQQQKIEELTLYLIEQDKRNNQTLEIVKKQQSEIEELNRKMDLLLSGKKIKDDK